MRSHPQAPILWLAMACFAWSSALSAVEAAAAEPNVDVEALIKRGNELRGQGKDFEAFHYYRRAYDSAPSPRTAGQLGLVEFALERWVDAEQHFLEALAASNDAWVKKNNDIFLSSLATVRTHIGELDIRGGPPGASVTIGSLPVGELPISRPVRVAAGHVSVGISTGNQPPVQFSAFIRAGSSTILQLPSQVFASPPEEKRETPASSANGSPNVMVPVSAPAPTPPTKKTSPGSGMRVAGFITATVGVAAVAGGIWAGLRVKDLEREYSDPANADRLADLESEGKKMERWQLAGYGLGAVALGAASYMLYLGYRDRAEGVALDVDVLNGSGFAVALRGPL